MNRRRFFGFLAGTPIAIATGAIAAPEVFIGIDGGGLDHSAGFAVLYDEIHPIRPGAFSQALKASELDFLSVCYRPAGSLYFRPLKQERQHGTA